MTYTCRSQYLFSQFIIYRFEETFIYFFVACTLQLHNQDTLCTTFTDYKIGICGTQNSKTTMKFHTNLQSIFSSFTEKFKFLNREKGAIRHDCSCGMVLISTFLSVVLVLNNQNFGNCTPCYFTSLTFDNLESHDEILVFFLSYDFSFFEACNYKIYKW